IWTVSLYHVVDIVGIVIIRIHFPGGGPYWFIQVGESLGLYAIAIPGLVPVVISRSVKEDGVVFAAQLPVGFKGIYPDVITPSLHKVVVHGRAEAVYPSTGEIPVRITHQEFSKLLIRPT